MARGNRRAPIFEDDHDRYRFLDAIARAASRFALKIYALCEMGNHYHQIGRASCRERVYVLV